MCQFILKCSNTVFCVLSSLFVNWINSSYLTKNASFLFENEEWFRGFNLSESFMFHVFRALWVFGMTIDLCWWNIFLVTKTCNPKSRYHLKIKKGEKVLEVGGGHNPHPRSNVVVDKFIDSNYHRHADIKVLKNQQFLHADGEKNHEPEKLDKRSW